MGFWGFGVVEAFQIVAADAVAAVLAAFVADGDAIEAVDVVSYPACHSAHSSSVVGVDVAAAAAAVVVVVVAVAVADDDAFDVVASFVDRVD